MKQSLFEHRHMAEWEQFSRTLDRLEGNKNAAGVENFPSDYRRLCQHLALARERGYSSFLIDSLQQSAARASTALSPPQPTRPPCVEFHPGGLRLVREQWRFVLAACLVFFGSLIGFALLVYLYPN
jgi:hypothetical protein